MKKQKLIDKIYLLSLIILFTSAVFENVMYGDVRTPLTLTLIILFSILMILILIVIKE